MFMTIERAIEMQAAHANESEQYFKALKRLIKAADEDLPYLPMCEEFAQALAEARQLIAN